MKLKEYELENTYQAEEENFCGDLVHYIAIDAFPTDDSEGFVVAKIFKTKSGDIVVDWHNNGFRNYEPAIKLIKESIELLKGN